MRLAVAAAALLLTAQVAVADQRSDEALARSRGAIGDTVPELAFRDAGGRTITLASLRGKPLLVNLIYTGCADVCPTIIESLAPAVDAAGQALGENSFNVLTIGFDTRNDTPSRMRSFAREHGAGGANWRFVASDAATMERLSDSVGFSYFSSAGGFDHLAQVTVLDKEGRIYRQIYGSSFATPAIVEPLKELVYSRERSLFSWEGLSDRVKLFCTVYNPNTGRYYFNYSLFASLGIGAFSVLAVFAFFLRELLRTRRRGAT